MLSTGKCTVLEGGEETLFFFLVGLGGGAKEHKLACRREKRETPAQKG